jgi:hypothetical protein
MSSKPKVKVVEIEDPKDQQAPESTLTSTPSSSTPVDSSPQMNDSPISDVSSQSSLSVEPSSIKDQPTTSSDIKDWLEDIRPESAAEKKDQGQDGFNLKVFAALVVVFALLGALAGGFFYYKEKASIKTQEDTSDSSPTPVVSASPSPTPEVVDFSKYNVNLLNGSGVAGLASSVKGSFVDKGFLAEKVATGNADKYDYEATVIKAKSKVPQALVDSVTKILEEKGFTVEVSSDELSASSSYDLVVTLGKKG